MRTRRQFRPAFDYLPGRIAPSAIAVLADPMDPAATPILPPSHTVDPMDPVATPINVPTSPLSPTGPGSYLPTSPDGTVVC
jgi:hypothetical protein